MTQQLVARGVFFDVLDGGALSMRIRIHKRGLVWMSVITVAADQSTRGNRMEIAWSVVTCFSRLQQLLSGLGQYPLHSTRSLSYPLLLTSFCLLREFFPDLIANTSVARVIACSYHYLGPTWKFPHLLKKPLHLLHVNKWRPDQDSNKEKHLSWHYLARIVVWKPRVHKGVRKQYSKWFTVNSRLAKIAYSIKLGLYTCPYLVKFLTELTSLVAASGEGFIIFCVPGAVDLFAYECWIGNIPSSL